MTKCILDTDIFSEILKKKNPNVVAHAQEYLTHFPSFTISIFTLYEVLYGLYMQDKKYSIEQTRWAIEQHEILPFTPTESVIAAKIESELKLSGKTIGKIDPMIASIAVANNIPLVTGNTSHYNRIVDLGYPLVLENWK